MKSVFFKTGKASANDSGAMDRVKSNPDRRTFLKGAVTLAIPLVLAMGGCGDPGKEPVDPVDPGGNGGNGGGTKDPSATTVKNKITAYIDNCEKNHKHPTLEECADCLSKGIEKENTVYESDFVFLISKPNSGGVDKINVNKEIVGKKLTDEKIITKGFRTGEVGDNSRSYGHVITSKA